MHFNLFEDQSLRSSVDDQKWYANLEDSGQIIATTGDGYFSKLGARHAIGLMVATSAVTPIITGAPGLLGAFHYDARGLRFEIYEESGVGSLLYPHFRWRLVSSNGNKIVHGNRHFERAANCLREIGLVVAANANTDIRDASVPQGLLNALRGR